MSSGWTRLTDELSCACSVTCLSVDGPLFAITVQQCRIASFIACPDTPLLSFYKCRLNAGKNLNAQVVSVQDLKNGVYDLADCSHKAILVVDELEVLVVWLIED